MHRFAVSGRSRSPHRCVRYIAFTNQPMTDRDPTLPGAEAQSDHDTPDVFEQPAGPHAAAHHFDVAAANSGQPALGGVAPPGGVAPAARSAAHLGCGLLPPPRCSNRSTGVLLEHACVDAFLF